MIGLMFMRVNSKCAHQVRPPLSPWLVQWRGRNSEESRKTQLVFSAKAEVARAVAPEYVRDPSSSDLRRQESARIRTAPLLGAASAVPENSPAKLITLRRSVRFRTSACTRRLRFGPQRRVALRQNVANPSCSPAV